MSILFGALIWFTFIVFILRFLRNAEILRKRAKKRDYIIFSIKGDLWKKRLE